MVFIRDGFSVRQRSRQNGYKIGCGGPVEGHRRRLNVDGLVVVRPITVHDAEADDGGGQIGHGENVVARQVANARRDKRSRVGVGNVGYINQPVGGGVGRAAIDTNELKALVVILVVIGDTVTVRVGSRIVV